jgi:ATP/maltotriose-dependent transcriptional regulator MalT
MPHKALREWAFQMRSKELREYGRTVLERDPTRVAASEVLDLMAYLIECDFIGAEAKIETIKYNFQNTSDEGYISEAISLAKAHIDFAFGRFDELEQSAHLFLDHHEHWPTIEKGEFLDIHRLLAQRAMFLDLHDELEKLHKDMKNYQTDTKSVNQLYLINSVHASWVLVEGNFRKAEEIAKKNIEIAKQNNYSGLMAPLDSMFVLAASKKGQAKHLEAHQMFYEVMDLAKRLKQWPWYFMAEGLIVRDLASENKMSEALTLIRNQRQMLLDFDFKHNLNFIPDINELYVRYLIRDLERIETLIDRVPDLVIVRQIRGAIMEFNGQSVSKWIEQLPEKTNREKLYKLIALSWHFQDKESIAVEYMCQALELAEETGFIELVLRQHELLDIVLKAVTKKPTVFLEGLASKMTEQVKLRNITNQSGIPVPLTTRELEVVRHLSTGIPISAISNLLHVSMNTMKTHLRNIYRKLEVDGREKAVEKAKALFLI